MPTIVQLVESLEIGGAERLSVDLALSNAAEGYRSVVYCLNAGGPLEGELERAGIPVIVFERPKRSRVAAVRAMAKQLGRDGADIVHGHNGAVHHFAAVAKWMAGVPVCINTRHSVYSSAGAPYQERYFRWVEPLTEHVVFVCDYVRNLLMPKLNYPAAKTSVILNGIPLEKFEARTAHPGSARPRLRFGAVGRLVPAKGYNVMLDAFAQVAAQAPGAELRIYGDGPLRGELETQIDRLGLRDKAVLAGWMPDASQAFEAMDVFVFSSINEGLPLVILEAMAAGLPIVSTRVGGVPEVLPPGQFEWSCEPGDANGLAAVMLSAAGSGQLAEAGLAGRQLARDNYGLTHMGQKHRRLYDRLLGKTAGGKGTAA